MGHARGRRIAFDDKKVIIILIDDARQSGCRLKIAAADIEIDFKTYLRWKVDLVDKRQGPISTPKNKLSEIEKTQIIKVSNSKEYMDYSPWIIVAKLADKGIYIASESSFYKVLKESKLLNHRGKSKPANRYKPKPLTANGANQIWSWDITYLKTLVRGQFYYVYLMMDIWSRKIVGFDIFEEESMEHSSTLVNKLCVAEGIKKDQLVLHSDNGGPMKGATMLATLERLGVAASFSRPRVSNDNAYSESLFKTLKYCPKYPDHFKDLNEAKSWMIKFTDWYNNNPHSGIKFVTPNDRHSDLDINILINRKEVYLEAKNKNPSRWNSKNIRNWDREEKVYLNHLQKSKDIAIKAAS